METQSATEVIIFAIDMFLFTFPFRPYTRHRSSALALPFPTPEIDIEKFLIEN